MLITLRHYWEVVGIFEEGIYLEKNNKGKKWRVNMNSKTGSLGTEWEEKRHFTKQDLNFLWSINRILRGRKKGRLSWVNDDPSWRWECAHIWARVAVGNRPWEGLALTGSACLKLVMALASEVGFNKETKELQIRGVGYGCCCQRWLLLILGGRRQLPNWSLRQSGLEGVVRGRSDRWRASVRSEGIAVT